MLRAAVDEESHQNVGVHGPHGALFHGLPERVKDEVAQWRHGLLLGHPGFPEQDVVEALAGQHVAEEFGGKALEGAGHRFGVAGLGAFAGHLRKPTVPPKPTSKKTRNSHWQQRGLVLRGPDESRCSSVAGADYGDLRYQDGSRRPILPRRGVRHRGG